MLDLDRLSSNAQIVLKLGCAKALIQGHKKVQAPDLSQEAGVSGVSGQDLLVALEELDRQRAIDLDNYAGAPIPQGFTVTEQGLEAYCQRWRPDYENAKLLVKKAVWDLGVLKNWSIDPQGNFPPLLIDHILQIFQSGRFLSIEETCCGVRPGLYIRHLSQRPPL